LTSDAMPARSAAGPAAGAPIRTPIRAARDAGGDKIVSKVWAGTCRNVRRGGGGTVPASAPRPCPPMAEPGLRERKKQRTREAILKAAFAMFAESGFDRVHVADIAAAAEVSKPTLFAYFPTKEDLVLHRFSEQE